MNRLVHELDDFGRIFCICPALLRKLCFMHFGHKCNSGQMLSEPVVQVLPDATLFSCADIENRFFEMLPFGDVDAGSDDVIGRVSTARQKGARPCNQPLLSMFGDPTTLVVLRKKIGAQHLKYSPKTVCFFWKKK